VAQIAILLAQIATDTSLIIREISVPLQAEIFNAIKTFQ
jgi:hypothetical protein